MTWLSECRVDGGGEIHQRCCMMCSPPHTVSSPLTIFRPIDIDRPILKKGKKIGLWEVWDDEAGGCCSGRLGGVECGAVEMANGMRSSERKEKKTKTGKLEEDVMEVRPN
jgi:hypothetical protein